MIKLRYFILAAAVLPWTASSAELKPAPAKSLVPFALHRLGNFRSEACGVGDFNGDRRLDIIAGAYLYLAPDWKPQQVRKLAGSVDDQGKGYHHDFMNVPLDVDADGRLDVVSVFWHEMSIAWYRNTGAEGLWPETVIDKNGNFECGELVDLTGEGKLVHILPHVQHTMWYELAVADGKPRFVKHVVSEKQWDYGAGVGDVNADGRPDIIRPGAWYEAPADARKGKWVEHLVPLGHKDATKSDHTPEIRVYDVNRDGLNDIITSSAHGHGIFWYEQTRSGWKQHTIDHSWSQAHSITLADIDRDGTLDLVTGKRFMAHNGSDPDEYGPLGVYWYKLTRGGNPSWTKYALTFSEGIGAALNIPVVDIDADGDLDVVVTGKWGGPALFENKTR